MKSVPRQPEPCPAAAENVPKYAFSTENVVNSFSRLLSQRRETYERLATETVAALPEVKLRIPFERIDVPVVRECPKHASAVYKFDVKAGTGLDKRRAMLEVDKELDKILDKLDAERVGSHGGGGRRER